VIKAGLDEFVLTESRYSVGETGPGPHIHREHCDCFFVLDGSLKFGLADNEVEASGGDFVLIRPGLVHTFGNQGPGDARFLNVQTPGKGFDRHLIEMRDAGDRAEEAASAERFDTFDPPEDGGRPWSDALISPAGSGDVVSLGDATVVVKAGAGDTSGALRLNEMVVQPGSRGLTARRKTGFVTGLWFLDGTAVLNLGGREVQAGPGTFALVPPGVVYDVSSQSPAESVHLLGVMAPS
jgi:mannose-6-phosphate isomerase-like protein (cupin superfamily)